MATVLNTASFPASFEGRGGQERETARNALSRHVPVEDRGYDKAFWSFRVGVIRVWLPNFAWRRRAVVFHDLHHLLTGYQATPIGELEIAAWEFAAGRYPNACATIFCLPLLSLGFILAPRRCLAAYRRGLSSRTLYGQDIETVLDSPLSSLSIERSVVTTPDREAKLGYAGLVTLSCLLTLSGAVALALPFIMLA